MSKSQLKVLLLVVPGIIKPPPGTIVTTVRFCEESLKLKASSRKNVAMHNTLFTVSVFVAV
ncbi:hypothetical protein KCTC52924_03551 [Arenibacter antarcticus]